MRKKDICLFVFLLALILSPKFSWAEDKVTILIDGQVKNYTQSPVIINGRVMVPLRAISETLGAEVLWDQQHSRIALIKESAFIVLHVGSDLCTVNGEYQRIDAKPSIINGSTMVPLRFISTVLGATIQWDSTKQKVAIFSPKKETNLGVNKEPHNGTAILHFNQLQKWINSGPSGTLAEDNLTKEGQQLLKLITKNGECWADTNTNLVNLQNQNLDLYFYIHDVTKLSKIHLLMDASSNWSSYFGYPIISSDLHNGWNQIRLVPKEFYSIGKNPPDKLKLTNIKRWRIKVLAKAGEETEISFDCLYAVPNLSPRGKVTITFDDGFASVYSEAKPQMDKHKFSGVAYVISDLVGSEKRMTIEQLKTLEATGWDIGSHSKSHQDLTSQNVTEEEIKNELLGSKLWLIDNGFSKGTQHYSSPYGKYNAKVLYEIKKYYKSHRTILESKQFIPPVDPYHLKIKNVINTTEVSQIKKWIDEAADNKEWLILLFHSIEDPATSEIIVSPQVFQQAMDYLTNSDVDIVTISDVL